MKTLELTDEDIVLLRNALLSYLSAFSHDEADVITQTQLLLHKVALAQEQAPGAEDRDKAVV